jgi:hypothetical protein
VATDAPYTIRKTLPAIIVLHLVPLNGIVAYIHPLPKTVPFIITSVIALLIAGALVLRQRAAIHAALLMLLLVEYYLEHRGLAFSEIDCMLQSEFEHLSLCGASSSMTMHLLNGIF